MGFISHESCLVSAFLFFCFAPGYCETNQKALAQSIADLNDQIPQIEASVKGLTELKAQLDEELKQHKTDRSDATSTIDTATAQRAKDKEAFDAYSTEAKTNLAACKKAVTAIRKGMGESFLQSSDASLLQRVVMASKSLSDFDSQEVTSFLEGKMQGSGEIVRSGMRPAPHRSARV